MTMGIINITPDSFYDGGKMTDEKVLLTSVEKMVNDAYNRVPGQVAKEFLQRRKLPDYYLL